HPGVLAVVTGADLTWCDPYFGPAFRDRPILAVDVARYEGDPVAAVVAIDEAAASEALELIEVDYAALPAVITLDEALAPGASLVHQGQPLAGHFADLSTLKPEPGTNVCHRFRYARGHADAALADAHLVVEETFDFPRVQHYAMEPHAALAAWDETGALTVWASTQNPYSVRVELAKMFAAPFSRIRIVVPHLGGGFGSKTYAKLEPLAAVLARAAGRPVRLAASAGDAFRTVRRCSSRVPVRVGFARGGTLVGGDCQADEREAGREARPCGRSHPVDGAARGGWRARHRRDAQGLDRAQRLRSDRALARRRQRHRPRQHGRNGTGRTHDALADRRRGAR